MNENIVIDGQLCAIILYASYDQPGIQFFTPNELPNSSLPCRMLQARLSGHTRTTRFSAKFSHTGDAFYSQGQSPRGFFTDEREYHETRRGQIFVVKSFTFD
jgi:hypothetical protein